MPPILDHKHHNRPSVFNPIVYFAHVTNQMGLIENDFEKGAADGNTAFVRLISTIAQAWRARP